MPTVYNVGGQVSRHQVSPAKRPANLCASANVNAQAGLEAEVGSKRPVNQVINKASPPRVRTIVDFFSLS